MSHAIIL